MESSTSARMSPATRLFLAGSTVSMLGTGLVVAFTLIYLHQVRGMRTPRRRPPRQAQRDRAGTGRGGGSERLAGTRTEMVH